MTGRREVSAALPQLHNSISRLSWKYQPSTLDVLDLRRNDITKLEYNKSFFFLPAGTGKCLFATQ